jgi:hypothetical protein
MVVMAKVEAAAAAHQAEVGELLEQVDMEELFYVGLKKH